MYGFTPSNTICAPVTASRLAFGFVSMAAASTRGSCAKRSADACDFVVTRTGSCASASPASRPSRMAPVMLPVPRMARFGRASVTVKESILVASITVTPRGTP